MMFEFGTATAAPTADKSILAGTCPAKPDFLIGPARSGADLAAYHRIRRDEFVTAQGLFTGTDRDQIDDDPRAVALLATAPDGTVLGGVRLAPATDTDLGWWRGSRLVTTSAARTSGVGPALVRAACAYAQARDVLRFDATVQHRYAAMFVALGWQRQGESELGGIPHTEMTWPLDPFERLTSSTKSFLGQVLAPLRAPENAAQSSALGAGGFVGDDGVPLPGTDVIAASDAVIASMVERDPYWAGWCSVLVNVNDLSAMGARPVGLLDTVGAPTRSAVEKVVAGLAAASTAWRVPVLGGHTQVGVPPSLSVTALGRTDTPIPGGGGRIGDAVRLTVDVTGGWRPGYVGQQWDSSTGRSPDELAALGAMVAAMAPNAAKDVSMAGMVGTVAMMAEASGVGARIDVASIPRPPDAAMGQWLTCFPGFGMLTAGRVREVARPAGVLSADCATLVAEPGVRLHWPDGRTTRAVSPEVTGLGRA